MRPIVGAFFVAILLDGCRASPEDVANGPDPLKALAQHVESSRYGPEYWKRVAARDTEVWAKATRFCRQANALEYPTCASVKMVEFFQGNTRPGPKTEPFTFRSDRGADTANAPTQR